MTSTLLEEMSTQKQSTSSTIRQHKLSYAKVYIMVAFYLKKKKKEVLQTNQRHISNKIKYLHAQHQTDILKGNCLRVIYIQTTSHQEKLLRNSKQIISKGKNGSNKYFFL
jgi:hypothetical protein